MGIVIHNNRIIKNEYRIIMLEKGALSNLNSCDISCERNEMIK